MYFLIAPLLLLLSKFNYTHSQTAPKKNDWFPFEYEYTDETTTFLTKVASNFKISKGGNVKPVLHDLASLISEMNLKVSNGEFNLKIYYR